jgi:hypothetical protein
MRVRLALWNDKLLLLTLGLFFFAQSTYIRVALRSAFEGPSFGWGYFSGLQRNGDIAMVRGEGFTGHTDYLAAKALIVVLILLLGLRRPDGIFRFALLAWTSISLAIASWVISFSSEPLIVSKETLGLVNVPAGTWLLMPHGLAWLAALSICMRDWGRTAQDSAAWGVTNTGVCRNRHFDSCVFSLLAERRTPAWISRLPRHWHHVSFVHVPFGRLCSMAGNSVR